MKREEITDNDALEYHKQGKPGKLSVDPTKPLMSQRDLSLAYSPGVAVPCLEIQKDPDKAYDYTSKGNFVAVISNGTAVLGLGSLGALASKPVMEGKAVLFKRFADIDAVDIEVDTTNPDEFINCVKYLGPTWGGINLEDIKAPECFRIEETLSRIMNIPIFHDDQHGTAIITLAGLINAAHITGRKFEEMKVVVNGAGAAGIACIELMKSFGMPHKNVTLCDTNGVVYKGRREGMNEYKEKHAIETSARTLTDAMQGADVFIGVSVKGAVSKDMVKSMAEKPIIFAMANPDPEITPEDVVSVRADAIIATGRSDYNNQVNNVMVFPYIFRGALDVHASTINQEMKIAAAQAIAALAREHVPEEVSSSYAGRKMVYGPEYVIPVPFDTRLITTVPPAVAAAAAATGVARKPIEDMESYKSMLSARLDPTYSSMNLVLEKVKTHPKRMIFSEGEEEQIIRAAMVWRDQGYGTPILVGREKIIKDVAESIGSNVLDGIEIWNAAIAPEEKVNQYIDYLYNKTHRNGNLYRDCVRLVKNARNVFASCMLACGDGDALVTGVTKGYHIVLEEIRSVINTKPDSLLFGLSIFLHGAKSIFIADTTVNELPSAEQLAELAICTAKKAENFGHTPHVAFLSFSNFGNPMRQKSDRVRDAVKILENKGVNFEFDGEMTADVALNPELLKLYPFCRLTKPANVLIMPALHTANIASKLLQSLGDGTLIGPIICGLEKPAQIIPMGASISEIMNLAAFAAAEAIDAEERKL